MQRLFQISTIGLLLLLPLFMRGKDPCHYSTAGTDFWFGFMQNRLRGDEHYIEITVSARKDATFTIVYGPDETLWGVYPIAANTSEIVRIDHNLLEAQGSEVIENKGIHLYASDSVNVYALNYRTQSSDVAVIYPTESLGKEYYAMCYTPNPTSSTESNSQFMIVATVDNTNVKITPSVNTDSNGKANVPYTINLNKGQSYQVQSMNSVQPDQGDLTGSHIISDQPIAFYSGALSTAVPEAGRSRDHLFEQIPPTKTWGREFYTVPLRERNMDTYRVLAAEDGTNVSIAALNRTIPLNRGEFFEFNLTSDQVSHIYSTRKILLAQFCRSQNMENGTVGDPFMIILSPISQKINDVTFEAYVSELIQNTFYINITALSSGIETITLDDLSVKSFFKPFNDGKYSYAQIPISSGQHRLFNPDQTNGGFLAYVYGFGDLTESYGYGVGFNLDIQLEIGGSFDSSSDTVQICEGSSVQLFAGEYFQSYLWNTKETTSSIWVSKTGWYEVEATTLEGCKKADSIFVNENKPDINLGNDTIVCLPGELILKVQDGYKSYVWQDGSTSPSYRVDSTGYYSVTVTDYKYGCKASDTIFVEVILPEIIFEPNYPVVTINHPEITFTNLTQGDFVFQWDFGDGDVSSEMNPTHIYSAIKTYRVVLSAVSPEGCTDKYEMDVEVIPVHFSMPNAFRPDSDITENRIFLPMLNLKAVDTKNYQFRIYSRTGSEVFESTDPQLGWNGQNAEQGLYVWIIKYLDIQGYEHQQKGSVMLVR